MNDYYPIAQFFTRLYIIAIGFGLGWLLSKLAWSPESAWWLFWVPAGMLTAFAVSGFISSVLPIPRQLVYLALLGAAIYYALFHHNVESQPAPDNTVTESQPAPTVCPVNMIAC